jgi:HEAT repeat protein
VSIDRLCIVTIFLLAAVSGSFAAPVAHPISGEEKAWAMFERAAKSTSPADRAIGIRALGLLRENTRARELAEKALDDPKPEVRAAAATALGQMHATQSIPRLQKSLTDPRIAVVMAAAHSLRDLKDNSSAYSIYYDVLTGKRKNGDGLIQQQLDTLHNPRELARIGLEEGIGYVPFAGIGWDAWRYMHKKNPNPVRAVAASFLAHDPDPATGVALAQAIHDNDWIVRAAVIEAIAERGDPALKKKVEFSFFDSNAHVRYTAAAAVIRLSAVEDSRKEAALKR